MLGFPLEGYTRILAGACPEPVEWAGMTMVGIGGARSDANEANDMQKLVFVYLSRRASHLCKPGMTAGGAGMKKKPVR